MKKIILLIIRLYQKRPAGAGSCRFKPTCSQYTYDAVVRHGVVKGAVCALRRILRCHPLGGSGYDPVPTRSQRCK